MKPLRIHWLQHVFFEGLGSIENWIDKHGHTAMLTRMYDGTELPQIDEFDWLIIMGGPMAVYNETISWLRREKEFIRKAIEDGKVVIGICLGAQLIADVLGAKVYPNENLEIGWYPVELTEEGKNNELFKDFPQSMTLMHWHGDTFDIPEGAIHLAKSNATPNQAFIYNDKVLAMQYHLEMTPDSITSIIGNCRSDLINVDYVQSEIGIIRNFNLCYKANEYMEKVLDYFAEWV